MNTAAPCPHCHRTLANDAGDGPNPVVSSRYPGRAPVARRRECPHCVRLLEVATIAFGDLRPESFARSVAGEPTTPSGGTATVLVVEDDRDQSEVLRTVLVRQGYRVVSACNGVQGRDAVYRDRPDLVILDMMMPRMGGFPVLEHFRGKSDAPPIIMITANEGSRHKAYAEMLGVVGYLRKPFAMEILLDAVAKGLAGRVGPAAPAGRPPGPPGANPIP